MINQKPDYSIGSYHTRDNTREVYQSTLRRIYTKTIDDKSFCLCQSICLHIVPDLEEEKEEKEDEGCYGNPDFCKGQYTRPSWYPLDCGCMAPND